jgi:hypothetical protein
MESVMGNIQRRPAARGQDDTSSVNFSTDTVGNMSRYVCGRTTSVLCLALVVITTGCSSNLTRFDIVHRLKKSTGREVSRSETAAQGSGAAVGSNYILHRVTVGGSYLRRTDVSSGAGGHKLTAGLHHEPASSD